MADRPAIDLADSRLEAATRFGATTTINNDREGAPERIHAMTDGLGADVAIEAVGVPVTFGQCRRLIRPGGRVANVGVHGEPASLHLEELWIRNVTVTTGLVDMYSTPTLLRLIAARQIDPSPFVAHRFAMGDFLEAYDRLRTSGRDRRAQGRAHPVTDTVGRGARPGPCPTAGSPRRRGRPGASDPRGRPPRPGTTRARRPAG